MQSAGNPRSLTTTASLVRELSGVTCLLSAVRDVASFAAVALNIWVQ
jgi:hypothetical protein